MKDEMIAISVKGIPRKLWGQVKKDAIDENKSVAQKLTEILRDRGSLRTKHRPEQK